MYVYSFVNTGMSICTGVNGRNNNFDLVCPTVVSFLLCNYLFKATTRQSVCAAVQSCAARIRGKQQPQPAATIAERTGGKGG